MGVSGVLVSASDLPGLSNLCKSPGDEEEHTYMITDDIINSGSGVLEVRPQSIPEELRLRPQWVAWRAIEKPGGKLDKHPYNTRTGRRASTTDLLTWSPFEDVMEAYEAGTYDGIGFVLCSADPFTGIDLDHCVNISTGGAWIAKWARQIVEEFASYAEVTPSGTGLHIIVKGELPGRGGKRGSIEMYDMKRFFTVTGRVLRGADGD